MKVFNWIKAAKIIAARKPSQASAGLLDSWYSTSAPIIENYVPVRSHAYLSSTWDIPVLKIDGEVIECWMDMFDIQDLCGFHNWSKEAFDIVSDEGFLDFLEKSIQIKELGLNFHSGVCA